MSNQYDVLGKAPGPEELKKLSPDNNHVTIKKLSAGYGKMEILHNFDLCVSKAQSLCLIGPNGAGKSTMLDALCFGLFAKPFRSIKKDQLVNTINEKECIVEVDFIIGKKQYKIIRGIKPIGMICG